MPLPRTVAITSDASVYGARQAIREEAQALGFARRVVEELVLVASELSTNILKHAGRGELELRRVDHPQKGPGLELCARDQGPPIADFADALRDGWSGGAPIDPVKLFGRKGIGAGMGAIQRLSDELSYQQNDGSKEIRAARYAASRPR